MKQNYNDNIEVYRLYGSTDSRFWYVSRVGYVRRTYIEDSIEKCINSIFNYGLFRLEKPNNLEFKEFCSFSFDTKLRYTDDNVGIVFRCLGNTYPELFL